MMVLSSTVTWQWPWFVVGMSGYSSLLKAMPSRVEKTLLVQLPPEMTIPRVGCRENAE